jgi:hypothetical protein
MCGVSGDDHSRADRGLADPGLADRGLADRGLADRGLADRGLADRGLADRGLADRGLADRGLAGAEARSDGMNIASRRTRNPEISTASLGSEMPMTMITVPGGAARDEDRTTTARRRGRSLTAASRTHKSALPSSMLRSRAQLPSG